MTEHTTSKTAAASPVKHPSRLRAWLLWIFLLAVTGVLFLFTAHPAGKAVFFFILFLPFVSLLCSAASGRKLNAAFSLPDTASKHTSAACRLTMQNSGIFACPAAAVRFTVRNELTEEFSEQVVPAAIPSRGSTTVSFDFSTGHCGRLLFRAEEAYLYDWFRLFRIKKALQARDSVLILPDTFPCELIVSLPYSEQGDEENQNPLRGTEDPTEIYALRDYQPGDPVKRIHWKMTAKRGQPVVREISRPVSRTLLLYWKKTSGTTPEAADALAEFFASAALSLSRSRVPFAIGWQDAGGTHIEAAGEEDSVFQAISHAVQHGQEKPTDAPSRIPEEIQTGRFAKILWLSGDYPFEEEAFLPEESTVFLCSPDLQAIGDRYTVSFTPDEITEVFRAIQV